MYLYAIIPKTFRQNMNAVLFKEIDVTCLFKFSDIRGSVPKISSNNLALCLIHFIHCSSTHLA